MTLVASPAAFTIIKYFEGCWKLLPDNTLQAYLCPADVWTIGWGHTDGVTSDLIITQEMADQLLLEDVADVEAALDQILGTITVKQCQYDALTSLCFNLAGGAATLPQKCPLMWADLKAGNDYAAAEEFLDCDHALVGNQWVELQGLKLRRQAEANLFLSC